MIGSSTLLDSRATDRCGTTEDPPSFAVSDPIPVDLGYEPHCIDCDTLSATRFVIVAVVETNTPDNIRGVIVDLDEDIVLTAEGVATVRTPATIESTVATYNYQNVYVVAMKENQFVAIGLDNATSSLYGIVCNVAANGTITPNTKVFLANTLVTSTRNVSKMRISETRFALFYSSDAVSSASVYWSIFEVVTDSTLTEIDNGTIRGVDSTHASGLVDVTQVLPDVWEVHHFMTFYRPIVDTLGYGTTRIQVSESAITVLSKLNDVTFEDYGPNEAHTIVTSPYCAVVSTPFFPGAPNPALIIAGHRVASSAIRLTPYDWRYTEQAFRVGLQEYTEDTGWVFGAFDTFACYDGSNYWAMVGYCTAYQGGSQVHKVGWYLQPINAAALLAEAALDGLALSGYVHETLETAAVSLRFSDWNFAEINDRSIYGASRPMVYINTVGTNEIEFVISAIN